MTSDTLSNEAKQEAREQGARIIDKVRKLLAKAGSNPSAEEAAACAAKAEQMLAQYNINFADVQIEQLDAGEGLLSQRVYANVNVGAAKVISKWAQWLAVATADYYDCHCRTAEGDVRVSANQSVKARVIEFIGYELDVKVCAWMYGYLFKAVYNSSRVFAETLNQEGVLGNAMKRPLLEFRQGASLAIAARLRLQMNQRDELRVAEGSGNALVVLKRAKIEEAFGNFDYKTPDTELLIDAKAFGLGFEAGKRVDLNVRGVGEGAAAQKIGQG